MVKRGRPSSGLCTTKLCRNEAWLQAHPGDRTCPDCRAKRARRRATKKRQTLANTLTEEKLWEYEKMIELALWQPTLFLEQLGYGSLADSLEHGPQPLLSGYPNRALYFRDKLIFHARNTDDGMWVPLTLEYRSDPVQFLSQGVEGAALGRQIKGRLAWVKEEGTKEFMPVDTFLLLLRRKYRPVVLDFIRKRCEDIAEEKHDSLATREGYPTA